MKFLKNLFRDETWHPGPRLLYIFDSSGGGEAPRGDEETSREGREAAIHEEARDAEAALEREIEYKALDRKDIEGKLLKQIAAEHGMTEEELVALNREKSPNFHVGKTEKGSRYCYATDTVYAKKDQTPRTAPTVTESREDVVAEQRHERAVEQSVEAAAQRDEVARQAEHQAEIYLAQRGELVAKNELLPDFLRGPEWETSNEDWAEMLRLGRQADNPRAGRLVDVIAEEPLKLTPPKFREMIRLGAPNRLSFDDITQTMTGESAQTFLEKYEGLLAKHERGDATDPDRLEQVIKNREAVIVQAHKIFQALGELRGGRLLHEERDAEQLAAREEVSDVERVATSDLFDLDAAVDGRLERSLRGEQKEHIGLNSELVGSMKSHLEALGVTPELAGKADIGFTLHLLLACYGVEELIANGSISQKIADRGETVLHLESIPGDFNPSNPSAQAVADSIRAQGGRLVFNRVAAENMQLGQLPDEERTPAVLESAFRSRHETISWEDAETGGTIGYEELRFATRDRDTEAMLADLVNFRTHFDATTGQEVIDYNELANDMAYFLQKGIEGWSNDPDINIVRELERARVIVDPRDKEELGRLDLALRDLGENQNRINKRLQDAKRLAAKEPSSERDARVTRIQEEFDKEQAQIDDLIAKKQHILEKGRYVESLMDTLAIDPQNLSALTVQQKMFLQNGVRLTQGRRIEERVRREVAENLDQVIEFYADKPLMQGILRAVMGQFQDQGREVTPQILETAATSIERALTQDGFRFEPLPDFPEQGPAPMGAMAGSTEDVDGRLTGGQLGAALAIPVRLNDRETVTVTLTAGLGYTADGGSKAGLGMGLGKSWKLDEELTLGVHVGAGIADEYVSGGGVGMGASATLGGEIGDFTFFEVASAGVALSPTHGLLPGASFTVGFKKRAETYVENARSVAEFRAGLGKVETAPSRTEKVAEIAALPEMQYLVRDLDNAGFGSKTKEAVLLAAYEELKKTLGDEAEANLTVSPISGASITLIPVPPFIVPSVSFQFRGETITVFAVPNMNETLTDSGQTIEQALREKVADARIVDNIDPADWVIDPTPTGYNLEGERVKMEGRSQYRFTVRDLLTRNLDAQNAAIHESGFHLEPGSGDTEGMLNLQVNGAHGNVEIYMDPAMQARLTTKPDGSGEATSQDLYLALNQLDPESDLYITRETFVLPRKRNGSYLYTRVTLKGNPERSIRDIRSERYGMVTFRNRSNAEIIAPRGEHGEAATNVLAWHGMDEAAERAEVFESLGMDRYLEELDRVRSLSPQATEAGPDAIDPDGKLTRLAKDLFAKDPKSWLEESLFDEDWFDSRKDAALKIQAAANELTPPMELTQDQLNYVIGVIRKETYVTGDRDTQTERDAFRERNHRFFERMLSEKFSPEVAERILADVEGNETRHAVSPTTEVFTVVGRQGITGLRADTLPAGADILGYTDYSDDAGMRHAVLERLGALPSAPEALLRTTLALNVYEVYSLIQGVEDANLMTEIYDNPALLATSPEHTRAFTEFQAIMQKLQANQASSAMVEITTDYGITLELGLRTEVFGGTLEYCDNPTIGLNQSLVLGGFQGMTESELQTLLPRIRSKVSTPIYELFAAYSHQHTEEPPPPETEHEPAISEDEDVTGDEGTDQGEHTDGNLGDTPPVEDGGGAESESTEGGTGLPQ